MAQVELVFLHPVPYLFNGSAGIPLLGSQPHQQTLSHGGTEGIYGVNLPLGILFLQFLHGQAGGVEGSRQSGGEGQDQNILAIFQVGLQFLLEIIGIEGRRVVASSPARSIS